MELTEMTPRRPYLFRAFYDWLIDNELTPYVVVNTEIYGVMVPIEYVKDNQILLNIAPQSVGQYSVSNDAIEFNARFSGIPHHVVVPMAAIEAIYAGENTVGFRFEPEPYYENHQEEPKKVNPFRIVK